MSELKQGILEIKQNCKYINDLSFRLLTKFLNQDYQFKKRAVTFNRGINYNINKEYDYAKITFMYENMMQDM